MPGRRRTPQQERNEILPVQHGGVNYEFKYEPRCRVCNGGPELTALVNKMLINGETYTSTYNFAVQVDTRKKPITFHSVYVHGQKHMPSTAAVVRRTMERRAQKMGQDFMEGAQSLVSEVVYAETMMKKAFEALHDPDTVVSARDGLEAAKTLRQFTIDEEEAGSLSGVLAQLNEIIEAVRAEVPPEMWQRIVTRLNGPTPTAIVESQVIQEDDEDDEPFNPVETDLDRDDLDD
jgi:hypothetical protein